MDNTSLLLGILLICLFMTPILYVIFSNMLAEKKRLKTIYTRCKEKNIEVKSLDVIGNTIIGLDLNFKNLVVAERMKIDETLEIIPLNRLKSCEVKTVRVQNKTLDSVELDLIGENFTKEIIIYKEEDESNTADSEACFYDATRWEKTLKHHLHLS